VSADVTGARDHTLLVATTRERDPRPGTLYNGERAASLDYAAVAVSVPPNHAAGAIEWPSAPPGDPNANFVVRNEAYLDGDAEFLRKLNAQLAQQPAGRRKALIFVHGYNTLFAEGLYRFAQVVDDSQSTAAPVLFTWASRGKLDQYLYDNNSATAARDALEHTIRLVFASNADQVNILAHSMGNWVMVEALRQIKMTGGLPQKGKLGAVVLAAPDIDVDVFESELKRFGKPQKPFYVVLSRDDRALALSKFIAGGESRLGADSNSKELAAMGAVVIDLSHVQSDDPANHDKFAQLAQVAPQLAPMLAQGIARNPDDAGSALGTVVSKSLSVVGAPITIVEQR
jgi:esterase/lipase superfamily enzyme